MKIDPGNLTSRILCNHDFIEHNPAACTGCGRCAVLCVAGLWTMMDGTAQLGSKQRDRCLECGACFHACSSSAIKFRYPAGGTGIVYKRG
jgi:ferredoxin-like protein FixX